MGNRSARRTERKNTGALRAGAVLLLAGVIGLDVFSCAMSRRLRMEPVPETATGALAEARLEFRTRAEGWRGRARSAAERARAAAPDWVGPARFLDELEREDLLAAEALASRLDELEADPDDPQKLYLVGRLEGPIGMARFELANRIQPDFAWALHGRAWMTYQGGDARAARRIGDKAVARARNPWEFATFSIAQARYELALERLDAATDTLSAALEEPGLTDEDRSEVGVWLARTGLAADEPQEAERGFWRALSLLRDSDVTRREVLDLGASLLAASERLDMPSALDELEAALAARPGPGRDELRGRILMQRGALTFARQLLERVESVETGPLVSNGAMHLARISAGDAPGAVEDWLASLPLQVLGPDGLPRRKELSELVLAARAAREESGDDQRLAALADAMLAAGWYREARALAPGLAAFDLELALKVDAHAAQGRAVLGGIERLLELVDSGSVYPGPALGNSMEIEGATFEFQTSTDSVGRIEDLDELLAAMNPLFIRHQMEADRTLILESTPRTSYGPLATVLHPGPTYSAADEEAGRGIAGEPVLGLPSELLQMGRFGLFGESVGGGGPDGTVLRLLAFEERSGEHLGVAYSGTVAWCDGADVPSRPVRRGARITGAALHEGYWIDVAGVRTEHARWRRLEQEFLGGDGERARRALAGRGPTLPENADARRRVRVYAPLGESDRVRLALLSERPAAESGRVTLEELLEYTAAHEEGHLTDRTRFLPIAAHPFSALGLLFAAGLSPTGLAQALEYRAQLVALCVAADPRIPLAECLDGAEGGNGVTPHAGAYAELVSDYLEVLERERAEGRVPALDEEHYLIHQLHHLGVEDIRRAALLLAEEKGMVEDD